jgi:hypothetical protein
MFVSLKKWSQIIPVAMLFSCTLALFFPVLLFIPNALEFDFSFSQLLPFLGVVTMAIFLAVVLVLKLLPDRFQLRERGLAVVFALGFLLWFQGNLLVWKYGLLSGQEIDWGGKILYGLIDTPLWIALLVLAAWRPAFLNRWAKTVSWLLLLIQFLVSSFYVLHQPEFPSFKKYHLVTNKQFDFSRQKNIIVLVVDTFQSDIFQEIIDRNPAYKKYFRDFTYFRNTTGGFPSTYAAIPFLLTARSYDNSKPIQAFMADAYLSPSSIPRQLLKLGWEVDLFPAVSKSVFFDPEVFSNIRPRRSKDNKTGLAHLFDITLFRCLPHFLKRAIYNDDNWFLTRWKQGEDEADLRDGDFNDAEGNGGQTVKEIRRIRRSSPRIHAMRKRWKPISRRSARDYFDVQFVSRFMKMAALSVEKPVFKFYHWRGIHEPFRINADLAPVNLPLNRDNAVIMGRGEIKLINYFLEGLRELGAYDNALIFILGDHGHPHGGFDLRLPAAMAAMPSPNGSLPRGVLESGIPLLLVKRPGDHGDLEINDAPASQADIQATVFDELGLGGSGMGEPLFRIPADRTRERLFHYYFWENGDWLNRYLPELREYRINGNCWLTSSWRETGRVFQPGK